MTSILFNHFPLELQTKITSHLDIHDLIILSQVNRHLNQQLYDQLWRNSQQREDIYLEALRNADIQVVHHAISHGADPSTVRILHATKDPHYIFRSSLLMALKLFDRRQDKKYDDLFEYLIRAGAGFSGCQGRKLRKKLRRRLLRVQSSDVVYFGTRRIECEDEDLAEAKQLLYALEQGTDKLIADLSEDLSLDLVYQLGAPFEAVLRLQANGSRVSDRSQSEAFIVALKQQDRSALEFFRSEFPPDISSFTTRRGLQDAEAAALVSHFQDQDDSWLDECWAFASHYIGEKDYCTHYTGFDDDQVPPALDYFEEIKGHVINPRKHFAELFLSSIAFYLFNTRKAYWYRKPQRAVEIVKHMLTKNRRFYVHVKSFGGVGNIRLDAMDLLKRRAKEEGFRKNKQFQDVLKLLSNAFDDDSAPNQGRGTLAWDYDENGYDEDGYDKDGYDEEGYDEDGEDSGGYDRDGYDQDGFDRHGWNVEGYDRFGFDRDGYDADGYNRHGYDVFGYDVKGKNRKGRHRVDA